MTVIPEDGIATELVSHIKSVQARKCAGRHFGEVHVSSKAEEEAIHNTTVALWSDPRVPEGQHLNKP